MRVVHYVRVSTDEQGKSGYSVREQPHTLNAHSEARGDEVVEEIADEGYSGASPERPGLARVMELAESGDVDVVRAVKRDRLFRSRLYRLLTERDLEEFGVKLEALNDTGHRIGDGVQDDFAEWEREEITRRTLSGKLQKAREGKIVAGRLPVYGFRYTEDRNHYEVDETKMVAIRRLFSLIASGTSVAGTARILTEEGFPAPGSASRSPTAGAASRWQRPTVREAVLDDSYKPHSHQEISALVSRDVASRLDPELSYGVWYYNRREVVKTRRGKKIRKKPKSEWVAVPVPDAGVPREILEAARRAIESNVKTAKSSRAGHREWALSGGIIRCGECGCALVAHTSRWTYYKKDGTPSPYERYAYRCATYRRTGRSPDGCSMSKNLHAANTEAKVWHSVRDAMLGTEGLDRALKSLSRKKARKTDALGRLTRIQRHLGDLRKRRDGYLELAADGLMPHAELSQKLRPLDAQIAALAAEVEGLASEARRREGAAKGARAILKGLKEAGPDALDSLDGAGRRQLYEDVELRVVAHGDGSLTMTWLVDLNLGEFGWENERTSTR